MTPTMFGLMKRNAFWLYVGQLLPRLASLIIVPIWSARVAPEEYARWILALTSAELVLEFGGLGFADFLTKVLYRYHDSRASRYFGMGATVILAITATSAGLMAVTSPWLSHAIVGPEVRPDLFGWLGLYVLLAQVSNLAILYLSSLIRYGAQFVLVTLRWIGNAAFLLLSLLVYHQGFYSWVWAWVATEALLLPVALYQLRAVRWGSAPRRVRTFAWCFSLPSFATNLVGLGQNRMGRYLLSFFGVHAGLGMYGIAQNLANNYGAVVRPVKLVAQQIVGHALEADAESPHYLEFFHWFTCVALCVAFLVALFLGDLMKLVVSPSYWGAARVLPVLVFTLYFQELCTLYQSLMFRYFKVWFHCLETLLAFPIVLAGTLTLVPRFGVMGAAVAQMAGAAAMVGFGQWYARRVSPRPFRFAEKALCSAAALGLVLAADRLALPLPGRIVLAAAVVVPYLLAHWRHRSVLFPLSSAVGKSARVPSLASGGPLVSEPS